MNIDEMLEISDCPLCEGGALLEEECGCSYYVMCLECGCHTVNIGCLTHFSLCATIHGKAMKETIVYAVTLRQGEASWTASVLRKR